MTTTSKTIAALAAGSLVSFLFYTALDRNPAARSEMDEPAANFSLPNLQGKPVSLSDFKGQVVLLAFWATWCDPCLDELPDLKRLYETYKTRGFTLLAVSMDEEPKDVPPFVQENGLPYPVLLASGQPLEGYNLPGVPAAYLVSPEGRIVQKYLGTQSYGRWAQDVERLLPARR